MRKIYDDPRLQYCYDRGFDAGKNGANKLNSHYLLFTSPDKTKAWEHGNKEGKGA